MKKLFALLSLFTLLGSVQGASPVEANSNFVDSVTCIAPTGSLKVSYDSGTHGIVGDSSNYSGSDKVYIISDSQLMQCFCPENGSGIQTDWKKVTSLSSDEAKILKSQGFIEVPSGQPWGLEDQPYMAKNLSYTCKSSNPGGSSDGRSDGKSSYVQSETSKPSLATTGNITLLATFLSLGAIFTLSGLLLRKSSH